MKFILILIASFLTFSQVCFAENVNINAETDKVIVSKEDVIELTITVSGKTSMSPELPDFEGFSIIGEGVSNQMDIVNFEYTKRTIYTYTLQAKDIGKITIGSASISDGGRILKTNPIEITVVDGLTPNTNTARRPSTRQRAPAFSLFNSPEKVIIDSEVSKTDVYIGEQIVFDLNIFSSQDDYTKSRVLPPSSKNFLTQSVEPAEFSSKQKNSIWMNCETRKFVLYPLNEGTLTIDPFTVNYHTHFRGWRQQSTDSMGINVKKLPEPQPENYGNGVGKFTMTTSIEPSTAIVGKPLTLSIVIEGTGNVSGISINIPEFDGFTKFSTSEDSEKHISGNNIIERKTIKVTLVPQKVNCKIQELSVSFFDPEKEDYYNLNTEPIEITALNLGDKKSEEASPAKNTVIDEGYREIKPTFKIISQKPIYTNTIFLIITFMPAFIYIFILLPNYSAKRKNSKSENVKKQFKNNSDYSSLYKHLFDFLTKKLELAHSATVKDISERLRERNIDEDSIEEVKDIFKICDVARFTSTSSDKAPEEISKKCISIVKKIEKALKGDK